MLQPKALRAALSLGLIARVSATIYPTQPISTTVFHGNKNNTVSWLGGSGYWDLQLLSGDEVSGAVSAF